MCFFYFDVLSCYLVEYYHYGFKVNILRLLFVDNQINISKFKMYKTLLIIFRCLISIILNYILFFNVSFYVKFKYFFMCSFRTF